MLVCSTKKGDVKDGLKALLKSRKSIMTKQEWDAIVPAGIPPIIQVSVKDYKHLTTISDFGEMSEQAKRREIKHVININTLIVHKKDCGHAGKAVIKAVLTTPRTTGLQPCGHCKPWVAPLTR